MNTETSEAFDARLLLCRSVWWLWPVGALFSVPGFHALGQVGYRWWTSKGCCFGKRLRPQERPPRRKIPFMDLP